MLYSTVPSLSRTLRMVRSQGWGLLVVGTVADILGESHTNDMQTMKAQSRSPSSVQFFWKRNFLSYSVEAQEKREVCMNFISFTALKCIISLAAEIHIRTHTHAHTHTHTRTRQDGVGSAYETSPLASAAYLGQF